MKPIQFPEAHLLLGKDPNAQYSEAVISVNTLPVWSDGESVVSCWRGTWKERLSFLLFGKAWLSVLGGSTQPPVTILASKTFFVTPEERDEMRKRRNQ